MLLCPQCGRTYGDEAKACAYDGATLEDAACVARGPGELGSGDVLGVYRVLNRLAIGGMGMIYRAEHVRLGRKVALKVLKQELISRADIIRRFFEEARAVNEIGHPNIVDIIDFVEELDTDPARVYMVMELLRGQDLASRIRAAGPLDPAEVVAVARQVVDALIAVHRVKILHRDLKPENVFLAEREGQEGPTIHVKLLDFGVAKVFGDREAPVRMTDPGTAVGTPEYMAPEQILGRDLDDRTDIYAIGVVLYDMLTNSVPFQSTKYGEVLVMQVKEAPPPLATRRGEAGPVPPRLEGIVMRCLRKDPADRYQNMRELRVALDHCLDDGQTIELMPVPTTDTQEVVTSRRQLKLWVAAGIILLTALGVGAAVWALRQPAPPSTSRAATTARPDAGPRVVARPLPDAAAGPERGTVGAVTATDRVGAEKPESHPGKVAKGKPKAKATGSAQVGKGGKKKGRHGGLERTIDPFAQ